MIDETKLTAYALNELSLEDRAQVDSELADDPTAKQTIADIQATAALLTTELSHELAATPPLQITPRPARLRWATTAIGLAAAAAIAAGLGIYLHRTDHQAVQAIAFAQKPARQSQIASARPEGPMLLAQKPWPNVDVTSDAVHGNIDKAHPTALDKSHAILANSTAIDSNSPAGANGPIDLNESVLLPDGLIARETAANAPAHQDGGSLEGREKTIAGLIQDARQYVDDSKYTEALAVIDSIQQLDPNNTYASDVRQFLEEHAIDPTNRLYKSRYDREYTHVLNDPKRDSYSRITDNPFVQSLRSPLSTFAVDVDTASYANVRRFIENGQMPPADAVRIEELINYFPYSTPSGTSGPKPSDADPVAVHVEVAECPWQREHQLARISLKAKSVSAETRPPSNLVFLIDVSSSMADENKLPLLKVAIKKLVGRLTANDRISIVTYAGNAQTALSSMPCSDDPIELPNKHTTGRQQILDAIDALNADGETNGGDGIQLAYKTAVGDFIKGGVNRVILSTDGDFNVGITDPNQLTHLIESEATTGVYLTVLGVGMGNVKDSTMEQLANHGKGNYAYLDSQEEADKVLGRQINSTLVTVAKDVKLQVEFNPAKVAAYRLIGYEHRAMPSRDFANDKKSAGEMGAGHSVVALYELIPANGSSSLPPLKYQPGPTPSTNPAANELMTVNVRYQLPERTESRKLEVPVADQPFTTADTTNDFRFSAAVAAFGMILRDSPYRGDATLDRVITQASSARGEDVGGYRLQFIELAKRAKSLCGK
jgi:Ca-activated chloride channel family protein